MPVLPVPVVPVVPAPVLPVPVPPPEPEPDWAETGTVKDKVAKLTAKALAQTFFAKLESFIVAIPLTFQVLAIF
ncbi:hypothetical protein SAMD00079811_44270 [Scytonema sp. HK-05]|nr:hypothetical protein SAMD00079811_44270 [Scytonema sp. HK-05]